MVGALNNLKKQALSGDPPAISVYGDFTYWNCFLHGTSEQVDNYATMQTQKSPTLPAADAEWLRDAAAEDVAINKTVVAACREAVNVGQVFDMVDESAKQGDGANLFLSSKTANDMPEMQRRLRAAALAGSPDAQFEIAFTVLGGYQKELLGTGPDALNVGDLLRESAEQIPQAEGNLAICEFYGCGGIDADPTAGVRTALTAAEHGSFDALLDIGPHLGPSQLDPTDFDVLRFGRPSVAVCDDKDLDLQVTASDGEEGTVILRARIQRVARPQPDEFGFGKPTAVDTAWSSESPPLRVRYGKSAEVSMTDQDHKTWKVALYPDRMRGAIRQVRVDQ
jgi:hypothetical protein